MPRKRIWTPDKLLKLYRLREEGKSFEDIAKSFKQSYGAVRRAWARVQWTAFLADPENYYDDTMSRTKRWTDEEMIQLDAYLQSGKSYDFIADKLERSIISVERTSQQTDWKAWREIRKAVITEGIQEDDEAKRESLLTQFITALLAICRNDFKRLEKIKENEFLNKVNLDKSKLFISFSELKKYASNKLVEFGYGNPETVSLGSGTYVIVGDSHGKHTRKDMFALLRRVNKELSPDRIIHIGHILDDDNDISYDWGVFDNLIILGKMEELKVIQEQRNKFKFNYDIVQESISLGDLVVLNQDMINDFVKTPISNLDSEIFDYKVIVNCHRHEFFTRCSNEGTSYLASPGSLCEKHIISTIKQIDFEDGRIVKQARPEGFIKYRRMNHMNKYWEQGLLVVHVDKKGNHTIVPCRIKRTSKGYTTSYFDKIISSRGVFKPEKKIFVNGDMHCDLHDHNVLDVQQQICKDYKPDVQVNLGDTFNYLSLNHHIMDRGGIITERRILDEAAQTHYVLSKAINWAKESYLIYGNHERFAHDFVEKFPQFARYLDFRFICDLENLGYKLVELKNEIKIGSAKFVHGEIRMYGQPGSKLEKTSRTFGKDVFIGHVHRPAIRFGCYSVGLSGILDQEYNEPNASNWLHGFGLCNQYKGKSWSTTIAIIDNKCVLNKKTYRPVNPGEWKVTKYNARIAYEF